MKSIGIYDIKDLSLSNDNIFYCINAKSLYHLKDLSLLNDNAYKEVETLYIRDGKCVEQIDFERFKKLQVLCVDSRNISNKWLKKIKKVKNIKTLLITNCGLKTNNMETLVSKENWKLPNVVLNVEKLNLDKNDFLYGLGFLNAFPKLKYLSLFYCSIDSDWFNDICDKVNVDIEYLDLQYNKIEDVNEDKVARLKNLKKLNLSENLLDEANMVKIIKACPNLEELYIRWNLMFNKEKTVKLAEEMIKHFKKLKILDITDTPFSDEAINIIKDWIKTLKNIKNTI